MQMPARQMHELPRLGALQIVVPVAVPADEEATQPVQHEAMQHQAVQHRAVLGGPLQ
jgi:hypothetical protein